MRRNDVPLLVLAAIRKRSSRDAELIHKTCKSVDRAVHPKVTGEVGDLSERLAATLEVAGKRPLARVSARVDDEVSAPYTHLSTALDRTRKRRTLHVREPVICQNAFRGKSLATALNATGEWSFGRVVHS